MKGFSALRWVGIGVVSGVLVALGGCALQPTIPVAAMGPEAQRVSEALDLWPEIRIDAPALKRPFFATIHMAGRRVTASGLLQFHDPRDFRITAVTEMGGILFDARMNWAGVTVLRKMPGLDSAMVETMVHDLSLAFAAPSNLDGLAERGPNLILKRTQADTHKYTWIFDPPSGHLKQLDVDVATFDTLKIDYPKYNGQGWPEELFLSRRAHSYTIGLTFSDNSMARQDARRGGE